MELNAKGEIHTAYFGQQPLMDDQVQRGGLYFQQQFHRKVWYVL